MAHHLLLRRPKDSDFPADVLAEIQLRLPPSARRRARLVCGFWRDVVDERTTEMQSRPQVLLWGISSGVAYVVDDLSPSCPGRCRELWRSPSGPRETQGAVDGVWRGVSPRSPFSPDYHVDLKLVGTSNGLLCLCDNEGGWTGGTITLVNPTTGETLSLPPLPCGELIYPGPPLPNGEVVRYDCRRKSWHQAYCFGYHPTTGRYKVVHVPCSFSWGWKTDAVHVLTLGEKAWREVRPASSMEIICDLDAGIVSVDGATYWIAKSLARLVSFDLDDERVDTCDTPFAPLLTGSNEYNLTEVCGRLGIVIRGGYGTTVWVRETKSKWSRWYSLACAWQDIPRPHFAYGECFLKAERSSMYIHRRSGTPSSDDVVEISHGGDQGMLIAGFKDGAYDYWTFAHVETLEPLGVYTAG